MRSYTKYPTGQPTPTTEREDRWINQKKWGFRIYRTTYKSDEQWSDFMTKFKGVIRVTKPWRENDPLPDRFDEDPVDHELMASLDLDIVSDRVKFDGATRPQLIADFKAWAAGEEPKSEVQEDELAKFYESSSLVPKKESFPYKWEKSAGDPQYHDSPRYRFFIQIDQECLESVLAVDDPHKYSTQGGMDCASYAGWVNVVNSRWPLDPAIPLNDSAALEIFRPWRHDPDIEFDNGCWFRATPCYLYPHLFASLAGPGAYREEYLRPPRVATHGVGGFEPQFGKAIEALTEDDHEDFRDAEHPDRRDGIWYTTGLPYKDPDEEDDYEDAMDEGVEGE